MERLALAELRRWKARPARKPLIVRGARQVGKSWLVREFARLEYRRLVYVNFDESRAAADVFAQDLDVSRILDQLALIDGGGPITPDDTLLFFDEIQGCPRAVSALKYFAERLPSCQVIGAGSLLGVALHEGASFPVGKVEFLDLGPMTFSEFLGAFGRGDLAEALRGDLASIAPLHTIYADHLRWYYYVGGMPEAVAAFVDSRDTGEVRRIQRQVLDGYDRDFSKHAPPAQVPKLRELYESLPAQLGREDKKFRYGLAHPGARGRDYEAVLRWLEDAGLARRVFRVTAPRLPLRAYEDRNAFKLFGTDVGLLGAQSELAAVTLTTPSDVFTEFKGALTEQYVLQHLAHADLGPHYWSSDTGTAEVDFVLAQGDRVLPVEVKAERNLRAKSLRVYADKYSPALSVRVSMSPFHTQPGLVDLPLYAIEALPDVLARTGTTGEH